MVFALLLLRKLFFWACLGVLRCGQDVGISYELVDFLTEIAIQKLKRLQEEKAEANPARRGRTAQGRISGDLRLAPPQAGCGAGLAGQIPIL